MKVKNKRFFRQELFVDRVQTALKHRQMDYDNLCEVLNDEVGYEITKSNLKLYISERTINQKPEKNQSKTIYVLKERLNKK